MAEGITKIVDNDAVCVTDFNLVNGVTKSGATVQHGKAVLIGITEGTGMFTHKSGSLVRHLPAARGRSDWLEPGTLQVGTSNGSFGRSMLVEIRKLPAPPDLQRTFGDGIVFANSTVCVYEELLGPDEVRPMHHHAPRFVVALTDVSIHHKFGNGQEKDATNVPGGTAWIPTPTTHEVRNTGKRPFWAICVEHP
jgi:hypothetical protein